MYFRMLKYCLSIFYTLAFIASGFAQIAASAEADSLHVETGNPFMIRFKVPRTAGLPRPLDFFAWHNAMAEKNILTQSEWIRAGEQWSKEVTFIFFAADTLRLSNLPIQLNNGETALTNPLSITVTATPAPDDLTEMADIKDIRREPMEWTDYLPWTLAIAGGVLLVLLVLFVSARLKQKKGGVVPGIEIPPHQLAQQRLISLAQQQYWQRGLLKEYYAELTLVLREYLHKRYGIRALESTSAEIIQQLIPCKFPPKVLADLQDTLIQADLVKFAKSTPPADFHEKAFFHAQEFIQLTTPVIQSPLSQNVVP